MSRFNNKNLLRKRTTGRYYSSTIFPEVPLSPDDNYIITQDGDRLDNISFEFYNDTDLWWVIALANPNKLRKDSYYVNVGEQIRIPADPFQYINLLTSFKNGNR